MAGIDDAGQVAGVTGPEGGGIGPVQVWSDGEVAQVTPDGVEGRPYDISEPGQVVGSFRQGDRPRPFSWQAGVWTALPAGPIGGEAIEVNDAGQVVGHADTGDYHTPHAFVWESGVMTDLAAATGHDWSYARDINEHGQIAAVAIGRDSRAVLWGVDP